tara:strand:- start:282 stop:809 length:528 start_codon:yes stop_codon:yes gene_type:complete
MATIQFVNNLGGHERTARDKAIARRDPDLGTLSTQKYYKEGRKSLWKGKLAKTNPEVSKDSFIANADTFTFPDENGLTEADVARDRLAKLSYEVFPNPKNDFFLERPESDYSRADRFMLAYTDPAGRNFLGDKWVGPDQLNMFAEQALAKQPATDGIAANSDSVKGDFPSQGVSV